MVLRTILCSYDTVGPIHTNDSVQVLLFLVLVVDKVGVINISNGVLVLLEVIVIAEVGVGVSCDVFPFLFRSVQVHVLLLDDVLHCGDLVAKTGDEAFLLVEATAILLILLQQPVDGVVPLGS